MSPEARTGRQDRRRARIEAERPAVDLLAYAGASERRASALRHVLANVPLMISVPGGDEPITSDPMEVVQAKLANGTKIVRDFGYIAPGQRVAMIAADTLNSPLSIMGPNEVIKARKKPVEIDDVRKTFQDMGYIARNTGSTPFYVTSSAAGLERYPAFPGGGIYKPMSATISLNPNMVEYLGTEEGFAHYLLDFDNHHASKLFSNQGQHSPMGVTDVTAGLSLAVLAKMGAVEEIDMIPVKDPNFKPVLREALYTAYVGIDPTVLRPLQPDAAERIWSWPWLNEVTDHVMQHSF